MNWTRRRDDEFKRVEWTRSIGTVLQLRVTLGDGETRAYWEVRTYYGVLGYGVGTVPEAMSAAKAYATAALVEARVDLEATTVDVNIVHLGVARGRFDVPASIDQSNEELAEEFLGKSE